MASAPLTAAQERAALALFDASFDVDPAQLDDWLVVQCGDDMALLARGAHLAAQRAGAAGLTQRQCLASSARNTSRSLRRSSSVRPQR